MNYEEKYKEALERARNLHKDAIDMGENLRAKQCEIIFPELAESEDEKVRKWLITQLELKSDVNNPHDLELMILKSIAWLERQGEKHPDPYNGISFEHNGHIWGMCARDNGVDISCDKHLIKHLEKQGKTSPVLSNSSNIGKDEQKPEENKGNIGGISSNWSEEDEMFVHGLIRGLSAKRDIHGHTTFSSDCIDITETINWLQSIKDRVQPKQEWSEEDEKIINGLIDSLTRISLNTRTDSTSPNYTFYKEIAWLKSLKERKGGKV